MTEKLTEQFANEPKYLKAIGNLITALETGDEKLFNDTLRFENHNIPFAVKKDKRFSDYTWLYPILDTRAINSVMFKGLFTYIAKATMEKFGPGYYLNLLDHVEEFAAEKNGQSPWHEEVIQRRRALIEPASISSLNSNDRTYAFVRVMEKSIPHYNDFMKAAGYARSFEEKMEKISSIPKGEIFLENTRKFGEIIGHLHQNHSVHDAAKFIQTYFMSLDLQAVDMHDMSKQMNIVAWHQARALALPQIYKVIRDLLPLRHNHPVKELIEIGFNHPGLDKSSVNFMIDCAHLVSEHAATSEDFIITDDYAANLLGKAYAHVYSPPLSPQECAEKQALLKTDLLQLVPKNESPEIQIYIYLKMLRANGDFGPNMPLRDEFTALAAQIPTEKLFRNLLGAKSHDTRLLEATYKQLVETGDTKLIQSNTYLLLDLYKNSHLPEKIEKPAYTFIADTDNGVDDKFRISLIEKFLATHTQGGNEEKLAGLYLDLKAKTYEAKTQSSPSTPDDIIARAQRLVSSAPTAPSTTPPSGPGVK